MKYAVSMQTENTKGGINEWVLLTCGAWASEHSLRHRPDLAHIQKPELFPSKRAAAMEARRHAHASARKWDCAADAEAKQ
jgi:hypothetical protein